MLAARVILGGAIIAAASGTSTPAISQAGLLLQSSADPKVTLRVADAFVPLTPVRVALESTDVDRRVFVDADAAHVIRRLVIVQFERVRPGESFKFAYPAKPPSTFHGTTYRVGTYVYDDKRDAGNAPNSESEWKPQSPTSAELPAASTTESRPGRSP
jgi:hypothetical protein